MSGYIYFIEAAEASRIKIGWAGDTQKRLADLQCAAPERLALVASVKGSVKQEKALHRALSGHRSSGEWFRLSEPVRLIVEMAIQRAPYAALLEAALGMADLSPTAIMRRRQRLEWTRFAADKSLPDHWRDRYRQWVGETVPENGVLA